MLKRIDEKLQNFYELYEKVKKFDMDSSIRCLTQTEMHLINTLVKKIVTINELSDKLDLTIGTTSLAISKLEKKKFIYRFKSTKDKRKVFVKLTKKGEVAFDYNAKFSDELYEQITKKVSKKELLIFNDVLTKMISKLNEVKEKLEPQTLYNFNEDDIVVVDEIRANPVILNYLLNKKLTIGKKIKILSKFKNSIIIKVDEDEKTLSKEDSLYVYCKKKENK